MLVVNGSSLGGLKAHWTVGSLHLAGTRNLADNPEGLLRAQYNPNCLLKHILMLTISVLSPPHIKGVSIANTIQRSLDHGEPNEYNVTPVCTQALGTPWNRVERLQEDKKSAVRLCLL